MEDVGARAVTLSEKGKVARVLDKTKDSAEVVTLVEKLRQAVLIYQVSCRYVQGWKPLTPGADVATTVNIQPNVSIDGEFPPFCCLRVLN